MNYLEAIASAPKGADIAIFKNLVGWVVIMLGGENAVIANCNDDALAMIIAGASANKLSVWNAELGNFACGNIGQLAA